MFSTDLPRTAVLILAVILFAGCSLVSTSSPQTAPRPPATSAMQPPAVLHWLNLQQDVVAMQPADLHTELEKIAGVPERGEALYYYGLLHQQLKEYEHWITARDAFRQVRQDPELDLDQRQLAGILERYNQSRINWYSRQTELLQRYSHLERELDALYDEKELLEQKIQALTDLEAVMSNRKEQ